MRPTAHPHSRAIDDSLAPDRRAILSGSCGIRGLPNAFSMRTRRLNGTVSFFPSIRSLQVRLSVRHATNGRERCRLRSTLGAGFEQLFNLLFHCQIWQVSSFPTTKTQRQSFHWLGRPGCRARSLRGFTSLSFSNRVRVNSTLQYSRLRLSNANGTRAAQAAPKGQRTVF